MQCIGFRAFRGFSKKSKIWSKVVRVGLWVGSNAGFDPRQKSAGHPTHTRPTPDRDGPGNYPGTRKITRYPKNYFRARVIFRVPEKLPGKLPEKLPGKLPEKVPPKIPEKLPNVLQNLPLPRLPSMQASFSRISAFQGCCHCRCPLITTRRRGWTFD